MNNIRICLAESDDHKQAAYRLRYEVFYSEMGDGRYACHETGQWRDVDDDVDSQLLVAITSSGEVTGTLRLTLLRRHNFIASDQYGFEAIAKTLNISDAELRNTVARVDRVVVSKDHRRSGVYSMMQREVEQLAICEGCSVIVATVEIENHAAKRAFSKLGWRETPVIGIHNDFSAQTIFKELSRTDTRS